MLAIGTTQEIRLKTLKGKVGYKITKFQTISNRPGGADTTTITTIMNKANGVDDGIATIDLSNPSIMAVSYSMTGSSTTETSHETIVIDSAITNQNMFITAGDPDGGTVAVNYYIELETMALNDTQATQLTLKALRNVASR